MSYEMVDLKFYLRVRKSKNQRRGSRAKSVEKKTPSENRGKVPYSY